MRDWTIWFRIAILVSLLSVTLSLLLLLLLGFTFSHFLTNQTTWATVAPERNLLLSPMLKFNNSFSICYLLLLCGVKNGYSEKKHCRSISDLSDPSSTPRNFEDSRKNAILYSHVIAFTLYELETITKSFRSDYILGEGGFGTVYKGYIDENVRVGLKSLPVAVKVLNKEGHQGYREWLGRRFSSFSSSSSSSYSDFMNWDNISDGSQLFGTA